MRPSKIVFLVLVALVGLNLTGSAQQSLSISDGTAQGLSATTLSITMDATGEVQGYVLAIAYDDAQATATGLAPAGAAENAELIVAEILGGGVTLGLVMDAEPPYGGQSIAAGSGVTIATLTMTARAIWFVGCRTLGLWHRDASAK